MHKKNNLSAIFTLLAAWGLLRYAPEVGAGVRSGLQNCAGLLIPSLFPFMILAALVGATAAGQRLSIWTATLVRPLTGLPEKIGASFFMSFLGGFPVGAQMLNRQLEQGEIDIDTASRALCCCVNAGPSFLIGAVGAMLSPAAGVLLLFAQILSSLCVAAIQFRGRPIARQNPFAAMPKGSEALVESVRSAATGMFGICAFVTAFSALTALLRACGLMGAVCGFLGILFPRLGEPFFAAAISGFLEVTNGCLAAGQLPQGLMLCAFLVSFSSLSIIFQVKSCFSRPIPFGRFYRSRFLHGSFTCFFVFLGRRFLPDVLSAAALSGKPVVSAQPNTLISGACLVAMCTILILTPTGKQMRRC